MKEHPQPNPNPNHNVNPTYILLFTFFYIYNVCFIIKEEEESGRNYLPMIVKKERIPEVKLKVVMMSVLKKEVDQGLRHEKTLKVSLMQRYVLSFVLYTANYLHVFE